MRAIGVRRFYGASVTFNDALSVCRRACGCQKPLELGRTAQVYNHMILPLANARDRRTQILWGIGDFQRRFKRLPEGMWLPETAGARTNCAGLQSYDSAAG